MWLEVVKSHFKRSMSVFESPNPILQYFQYQQYIYLQLSHVPKGSQRFYYVAHGYSNCHMPTPSSEEILGEGEEKVENIILSVGICQLSTSQSQINFYN